MAFHDESLRVEHSRPARLPSISRKELRICHRWLTFSNFTHGYGTKTNTKTQYPERIDGEENYETKPLPLGHP